MVAYNEVTGTAQSNIRLEVVIMRYPQTGNEVFVSFSLSNTMFSGIGKGTITRKRSPPTISRLCFPNMA